MNDNAQPALDRLLEEIPVRPAPIGELLVAGRAARRRRRRATITGIAAATALVLAGGVTSVQFLQSSGAPLGPADGAASTGDGAVATHTLTVRSTLADLPLAYTEGALIEVAVVPAAPDAGAPRGGDPVEVGSTMSWTDLTAGSYLITVATRPCHGNCDYLDPPTDSCQRTIDLTSNTEVLVTIRWAEPCAITDVSTR
ncbi:hypothetical protein ACOACO_03700 [Nocardioides sp. CPCC 205120]|uniref:hypothetical protein n=1 Tax=Nocardioides sp. CPCC 205120 TaxID=3406462 RepID=UPI003B50597B